jgi:hypothetical protein
MEEIFEFRIVYDFANLLFTADEGKDLGQITKSIKLINIKRDDPRFNQIPAVTKYVREEYNKSFFLGWSIVRKYTKKELESASLLMMKIKNIFEPAGEECGTLYDDSEVCEMCGANRKQSSRLKLKKGSIPKKDIARTIAGEIVVSEKFATTSKQWGLQGVLIESVVFDKGSSNYYQLTAPIRLDLTESTVVGVNPFDLSTSNEGEIYKCPKGHTIGLNLLSEAYVKNSVLIHNYDFFASNELIGVRRGLLRPEPLYFCSLRFRKMVEEEKLTGFEFEVANVE